MVEMLISDDAVSVKFTKTRRYKGLIMENFELVIFIVYTSSRLIILYLYRLNFNHQTSRNEKS
jgi:hypothetical protein